MNVYRKIETDSQRKQISSYKWRGGKQKCMLGVQSKRHKVLCIKQISSKDILFSIEKYSHYLFIMFWSIICKVTESLCCSSETNIML